MKKTIVLMLFVPSVVFCGFEQSHAGARAKGLGGAYVGVSRDVWAVFYNPAGLSNLQSTQAGIYYSPQPFGIPELAFGAAAVAVPTDLGSFGVSFQRYGFELYREVTGTLSYANRIFDIGVGGNVHYRSLSIQNYGSAGTLTLDLAAFVAVVQDIDWGIMVKNLTASTIGTSNEQLPQVFSTGFSYRPVDKLVLALDYEKETKFDVSFHFGAEYQVVEAVYARLGFSDVPSQFAGGFGLHYAKLTFDYVMTTHQELGLTHQFSIHYSFGEE
jgi:hypothetical protein